LLGLEKAMRGKAKTDPSVAVGTLAALDGAWRLVFTTGTLDTQKKIKGRINYFPLKAVQCFSTDTMRLTNSIMVKKARDHLEPGERQSWGSWLVNRVCCMFQ
jgi:hypothetical protein